MASERPRAEGRSNAMMTAILRGGGPEREACLLDLSSRGLMALADPPPPRGSFIELVVAGHSLVGQVQWSEDRRFGVRLRERIEVQAVMGNLPRALLPSVATKTPCIAAKLAFWRHVARGFTYGILAAAGAMGASLAAQTVGDSLSSLTKVSAMLARH
ncbi:MAG: PilZ domain-containing protein [Novosphingobium sp.]